MLIQYIHTESSGYAALAPGSIIPLALRPLTGWPWPHPAYDPRTGLLCCSRGGGASFCSACTRAGRCWPVSRGVRAPLDCAEQLNVQVSGGGSGAGAVSRFRERVGVVWLWAVEHERKSHINWRWFTDMDVWLPQVGHSHGVRKAHVRVWLLLLQQIEAPPPHGQTLQPHKSTDVQSGHPPMCWAKAAPAWVDLNASRWSITASMIVENNTAGRLCAWHLHLVCLSTSEAVEQPEPHHAPHTQRSWRPPSACSTSVPCKHEKPPLTRHHPMR